MDYPIIIAPLSEEDGGGFMGWVPDLLGCVSDGESPEEATTNVRLAIEEWIDTAKRRGMNIPAPGSAALRDRAEKERLLATLKAVTESVDHVHDRIDELKRQMQEIQDHLDNAADWRRFADITSLQITDEERSLHS